MSVFVYVLGECYVCRRVFAFNGELVPSLELNGRREPFCPDCIARANVKRVANGLDPIVPLPGAYEPEELGDGELGE